MPLVQKSCEVSKGLSELRIILKSSVIANAMLTFKSAWLHAKAVNVVGNPEYKQSIGIIN